MLAKGSFELVGIELTEKFLEKLDDKGNPKRVYDNVYFDFIKEVLTKHGDKLDVQSFSRGKNNSHEHFTRTFSRVSEEYISLIYYDFSVGNINGYLEISRKKRYDEGRLLVLAYCNNNRELFTCLREMRVCQSKKKKGSFANAEKGIVKLLIGDKPTEI